MKADDGRDPLTVVIHGFSRESKEDIPLLLVAGGMSPDDVMNVRFEDDGDDDDDKALDDNDEYEYNNEEYDEMDDFEEIDLDASDGGDPRKIDRMMSTSHLDLPQEM